MNAEYLTMLGFFYFYYFLINYFFVFILLHSTTSVYVTQKIINECTVDQPAWAGSLVHAWQKETNMGDICASSWSVAFKDRGTWEHLAHGHKSGGAWAATTIMDGLFQALLMFLEINVLKKPTQSLCISRNTLNPLVFENDATLAWISLL